MRNCEICREKTSFERRLEIDEREGEICGECGIWVCHECYHYLSETPICFNCIGESQKGGNHDQKSNN